MFRWIPLVWANMRRRKIRLVLTFASIMIAFLLFGLLQALRTSMAAGVTMAGADRLVMQNKTGLAQPLPMAYYEKIRAVPGVRAVATNSWFGAEYRTPQNPKDVFPMFATQPAAFLQVYPTIKMNPADGGKAWEKDRQGLVVGYMLARKYGWKQGDRVSLRSQIFRKTDNTDTWQFNIVGIYESGSPFMDGSAYMQFPYFNESLMYARDIFSSATIRVYDAQQSSAIGRKIDALFANSSAETETMTEREWVKHWIDQIGDMGIIVTSVTLAVFFTMLLVTANRMAQSVRERTNEIGVMKTLGYSNASVTGLVIGEAMLVTALGAAIGLGLAALMALGMAKSLAQFFPVLGMPSVTYAISAVLVIVLGGLAAAQPSMQAARLKIVDALRKV